MPAAVHGALAPDHAFGIFPWGPKWTRSVRDQSENSRSWTFDLYPDSMQSRAPAAVTPGVLISLKAKARS